MRSFRYVPGSSFLHRLNPSVKLLAIALVTVAITFIFDVATPLAFLALSLAVMVALGGLSPAFIARSLLPFVLVALSFVVLNTLFHRDLGSGTTLVGLGPLQITWQGLEVGLSIGLRVLFLISTSLLFVATTEPGKLVLSLVQQARLSYKLAFALLVAYRFIPIFADEYATIRAAGRVRGIGTKGGAWAKLKALRRDAVPLLASAIRRSERLAIAMDSRAFGAYPDRTFLKQLRVRRSDWLFLGGTLLVSSLLLAVLVKTGLTQGIGVLFQ